MKRSIVFLVVIFSFVFPFVAQAKLQTFLHTVKQPFGGSQSPDDARVAAIAKAKREVLEIAGTYIESFFTVEETEEKIFAKDQVLALASGILRTEIISEENYATKDGFGIIIKARVQVDTSLLEERVKKLMADRTAMEQLTASRKREKELLDKIKILEEKNRNLAKQADSEASRDKKKELTKEFRQASKGLNAVSLNDQALALWKDGRFTNPKEALELLNKAIELDPNYAAAYNNRGNAWHEIGDFDRSIDDFNKMLELDPIGFHGYLGRGNALADKGEHFRAIDDFNRCLKINPNLAEAYHNRGFTWLNLKEYDRAMADFNKALELNPQYSSAYIHRAIIWDEMGDYERSISDNTKAIQIDPPSKIAYMNRGLAFWHNLQKIAENKVGLGEKELAAEDLIIMKTLINRAIADFKKALEIDPNYADAYQNLQTAYKILQSAP